METSDAIPVTEQQKTRRSVRRLVLVRAARHRDGQDLESGREQDHARPPIQAGWLVGFWTGSFTRGLTTAAGADAAAPSSRSCQW